MSTDLLQVDCQNLLSTGLLKLFQQVVTSLQMSSCNKLDFLTDEIDEIDKFDMLQQAGKIDKFMAMYSAAHPAPFPVL